MSLPDRIARPDPARSQYIRKALVVSFAVSPNPAITPSTVTVKIDGVGDGIPLGYCARYAPTNGDWVWVLTFPGLWLVLDKQG